VVETDGKSYAFRQKVSNFYLGAEIDHNKVVKLATKRNEWEYFTLEPRGNNQFAIKSCHGTYLGSNGAHPTWTNNPNNTCIWTIKTVNAQQNFNQGGFNQGASNQGFNQGNKGGSNQGGFTNNNTYGASNFGFQGGYKS